MKKRFVYLVFNGRGDGGELYSVHGVYEDTVSLVNRLNAAKQQRGTLGPDYHYERREVTKHELENLIEENLTQESFEKFTGDV